jgi:surfeit locus 1 family protein
LDQSIALDNRAWDGRAGVHVLTPLRLGDQSIVWVNRGWMEKAPGLQTVAFPPAIPAVDLPGVALASVMRRMELSRNETTLRQGTVWQNFDWESAAQRVKGNVWPVIVWQTGENSDGLLRRLPELSSDVPKHLGYAAQWFLLASVALFFGWRLRPRLISE